MAGRPKLYEEVYGRQAAYRQRQREKRLCVSCANKVSRAGTLYCDEHRAKKQKWDELHPRIERAQSYQKPAIGMTEKMMPMQNTQENVNAAHSICPKCSGCLVEVGERDADGDYLEMLRCLNCGFRQYAQPTGKSIEVVKGLAYE